MDTLIITLVFGVISGSLVAIGAVGFTLQYGITNVFNLSYGVTMTSAIFVTYLFTKSITTSLPVLLVIGAVWGAAFSLAISVVIIGPFLRRGAGLFGMAIVTLALLLIIEYSLEAIQGPGILNYPTPTGSTVTIGPAIVSTVQIAQVALALVLMLAVYLLLNRTRIGLAMRGMSADPTLTRCCGISTKVVRALTWSVSGALAGIAGVLLGVSVGTFDSTVADTLFIDVVAAAILGGIGEPYGAMIGGLVVGIITEGAAAVIDPSLKVVAAAAVIVAVLLVRPTGLLGRYGSSRTLTA
jgi:branched-chain amino acid transport system permease protein/neutral amino acid transport system permease protein